jgi:hypothetical protein
MKKSTIASLPVARLACNHRFTHLPEILHTMLEQIGLKTIAGISGGRYYVHSPETLRFPVGCGYQVEVSYLRDEDLYIVRRLFLRGDATYPKGARSGLYWDQLPEAVWDASCFRNVPFGNHTHAETPVP